MEVILSDDEARTLRDMSADAAAPLWRSAGNDRVDGPGAQVRILRHRSSAHIRLKRL
jgi:hypothetical protein